ncbi:MAG: hypothetical protein EHM35_09720, partial [Planctomycetaceae bacterium]
MGRNSVVLLMVVALAVAHASADESSLTEYGQSLPQSREAIGLWWASSGWKVGRDRGLPSEKGEAITVRTAKNEVEAAQFVIRPAAALKDLWIKAEALVGSAGARIAAENIEMLEVRYVNVARPTDRSTVAGYWPDPLPPF